MSAQRLTIAHAIFASRQLLPTPEPAREVEAAIWTMLQIISMALDVIFDLGFTTPGLRMRHCS